MNGETVNPFCYFTW